MRDLSINELADEMRSLLREGHGVELTLAEVRTLTREFFHFVETKMETPKAWVHLPWRDITLFFQPFDKEKLCYELAIGIKSAISYDALLKRGTLGRKAAYFLRRSALTMNDKALSM